MPGPAPRSMALSWSSPSSACLRSRSKEGVPAAGRDGMGSEFRAPGLCLRAPAARGAARSLSRDLGQVGEEGPHGLAGEELDLAEPLAERGRGARGPGVAKQLEDRVEERFGWRQVNQAHFFTRGNLGELSRASDGRVEPAEFVHRSEEHTSELQSLAY